MVDNYYGKPVIIMAQELVWQWLMPTTGSIPGNLLQSLMTIIIIFANIIIMVIRIILYDHPKK